MLSQSTILGLISKITKVLSKDGNAIEKAIANQVNESLFPPQLREPVLVIIEEKGVVLYKNERGKQYKATCKEGDTFDKYVGASVVLGNAKFKSQKEFEKELTRMFGKFEKNDFERYALMYQRFQHGGKENFEKFVDNLNVRKETE